MAILATQKVLTLDYWKIADDLKPGDIVFDLAGNKTTVTLIQKYRAAKCYRVLFSDGLSVRGDENLRLPIEDRKFRTRACDYKGRFKFRRPRRIMAVKDLLDIPLVSDKKKKMYAIPTIHPLNLPEQTLPVPPFVFGFWFFNCRKDKKTMCPPPGYDDYVHNKLHDSGYIIKKHEKMPNNRTTITTTPSILSHLIPTVPHRIPNNYLLGSFEQRLELLSGIMYAKTKQYNPKTDTFRFTSYHRWEVNTVRYLAESLGCKTREEMDEQLDNYTIFFKTKLKIMEHQIPKPLKVRQDWRYIVDITEIQSQGCVHIETDSQDSSFVVEEGFITCH